MRYSNGSAFISIHEQFFENELDSDIVSGEVEVDINGKTGKLDFDEDSGDPSLLWVDGNAMFVIAGQISSDEMIKIAESMG